VQTCKQALSTTIFYLSLNALLLHSKFIIYVTGTNLKTWQILHNYSTKLLEL